MFVQLLVMIVCVQQVWTWATFSIMSICKGRVYSKCSSVSNICNFASHSVWRSRWRSGMYWNIYSSRTGCHGHKTWTGGNMEHIQTIKGSLTINFTTINQSIYLSSVCGSTIYRDANYYGLSVIIMNFPFLLLNYGQKENYYGKVKL